VIKVRVGQDDGVNLAWRDRKFRPVAKTKLFQALKEAAVYEHALPAVLEQVFGPGDGAGGTEKRQVSHSCDDDIRLAGSGPSAGATLSVMGNRMKHAAIWLGVIAVTTTLAAQSKGLLTVDSIYHPERRVAFSGLPESDLSWLDAATYIVSRQSGSGYEWLKVDAISGRTSPLFDADRMETALASLPGVTRAEAGLVARSDDLNFNPSRTGALVTIGDDLYFYDASAVKASRLTTTPGVEEEAVFSPNGQFVAFVRANNLYAVDLATQKERALTTDGGREILNGKLDWLYQEEIYGRDHFQAYWWSPDSARIAFLQLDERPVPEYTVVDHIPYRPALEVTDYPKAGDPNPTVKVGVANVSSGSLTWVDLTAYSDFLVVDVDWTPDGKQVVHQVQDREQTWLDLNLADPDSGRVRKLLRETTKAWVNNNGDPIWLTDGSFLWFSERSGFKHLYRMGPDGAVMNPVTTGRWDVRTLYGVNQSGGVLYFAASEHSPIGTDIYRIRLDGTGLTRLSHTDGTHRAVFNPDFTLFADVWSNVTTPSQVRMHRNDGSEVRAIDLNPVPALRDYRLSVPEFVQVKTRDGFVMEGMMIKPVDFNPARRYPVYQFTYAGPGASQVKNQWGGREYMFHQMLAQHGVIVWVLDNRSASGKGVESQWPVYGRLGELELQDLEDGVAWLKKQPFVDSTRMVLSGWSYGGFMAAYALTHSTSWTAGIVGAPVTDWRDYDSVYTERLMKLPKNNPDGYRRTAPRFAADKLQGRMLLLHGTMDDNVHMQNSVQFAYELQKAGKPFEMMVYPKSRHGVGDGRLNSHLRQLMFDFTMRVVGPEVPPAASRGATR
jgi:dipeptidyl-peptidase-4